MHIYEHMQSFEEFLFEIKDLHTYKLFIMKYSN